MRYGETFEVGEMVGVTSDSRHIRAATIHRVAKVNKRYITLDDGQVFVASSLRPKGAGEYCFKRLIKGNEAIQMNQQAVDAKRARDAANTVNDLITSLKPINTSVHWKGAIQEQIQRQAILLRAALQAAEEALEKLA